MIFDTILSIATKIFDRVVPDKTKEQDQQFTLELTKALAASDVLKGQLEVNKAEAENPNRKWTTWRELLGYTLVLGVSWQWIGLPVVSFIAAAIGHPINLGSISQVDIMDMLYIMLGMLGLDAGPVIANRMKRK